MHNLKSLANFESFNRRPSKCSINGRILQIKLALKQEFECRLRSQSSEGFNDYSKEFLKFTSANKNVDIIQETTNDNLAVSENKCSTSMLTDNLIDARDDSDKHKSIVDPPQDILIFSELVRTPPIQRTTQNDALFTALLKIIKKHHLSDDIKNRIVQSLVKYGLQMPIMDGSSKLKVDSDEDNNCTLEVECDDNDFGRILKELKEVNQTLVETKYVQNKILEITAKKCRKRQHHLLNHV